MSSGADDDIEIDMERLQRPPVRIIDEDVEIDDECLVCLESFTAMRNGHPRTVFRLSCGCTYMFHADCIYEWFLNKRRDICPACSKPAGDLAQVRIHVTKRSGAVVNADAAAVAAAARLPTDRATAATAAIGRPVRPVAFMAAARPTAAAALAAPSPMPAFAAPLAATPGPAAIWAMPSELAASPSPGPAGARPRPALRANVGATGRPPPPLVPAVASVPPGTPINSGLAARPYLPADVGSAIQENRVSAPVAADLATNLASTCGWREPRLGLTRR